MLFVPIHKHNLWSTFPRYLIYLPTSTTNSQVSALFLFLEWGNYLRDGTCPWHTIETGFELLRILRPGLLLLYSTHGEPLAATWEFWRLELQMPKVLGVGREKGLTFWPCRQSCFPHWKEAGMDWREVELQCRPILTAWTDPTGSSGTKRAFWSCPRVGWNGWASIPCLHQPLDVGTQGRVYWWTR